MLVSIAAQNKDFNDHVKFLTSHVPNKSEADLRLEFIQSNWLDDNAPNENYFYNFTKGFEAFLYYYYHVDRSLFKYFDPDNI